jgi:hypothetical protein
MHSRRPKAYGYTAFPHTSTPKGVELEIICISLIYRMICCLSLVGSEASRSNVFSEAKRKFSEANLAYTDTPYLYLPWGEAPSHPQRSGF